MENAIVALISAAIIIISTVTMVMSSLMSNVKMADALRRAESRVESLIQTRLDLTPQQYFGGSVELTLANQGQVSLCWFESWDIIIQYETSEARYLDYVEGMSPGAGEWAVMGIFLPGGGAEVFDPGILNPGEELHLSLVSEITLKEGDTTRVTVATEGGVAVQCLVTREME